MFFEDNVYAQGGLSRNYSGGALNGNFVFFRKALMYWKIIMGYELENTQKGSYIICFDEL